MDKVNGDLLIMALFLLLGNMIVTSSSHFRKLWLTVEVELYTVTR